jgi:hypothetical protein
MAYSLAQAAKAVGRDRSTLLRMIKIGKLSATRNEATGAWVIEPAELHRVYPPADPHVENQADAQARIPDSTPEIAALQAQLEAASDAIRVRDDVIADLRQERDRAHEERRQVQVRLDALLTDQRPAAPMPPRRSWLPWRRRA